MATARIKLTSTLLAAAAAALAFSAFSTSAPAQNANGLPAAQEVMDKVVERARWVAEHRPALKYTFFQHTTIEKLDDAGRLKEREERVYELGRVEGEPFLRLIQKNGKPPTEKDIEEERKREREFRKRLEERRKKAKPEDEGFRFDRDLMSKYRAEVLGREVVNGRPAWVLRFEPKSRDLPVRKRVDRLTNKLAGKLWIDAQDYEIVKAEASLTEPARVGMGLLANFQKFDLFLEQTRLDDSTWLPARADALLQGRVIFTTTHERRILRWKDFRKADAPQKSSSP
jgi:Spy/CpxP family protein refolding chaperone